MADFSSLFQDVFRKIPLSQVANLAASATSPQIKRRAAVVAHDSYAVIDGYVEHRPTIFYAGLLTAGTGLAMAAKRRKQGVEAVLGWLLVAGAGAGAAWVTRPVNAQGAPVAGAPMEQVNKWLDERATTLDQSSPGWQERALVRLLG